MEEVTIYPAPGWVLITALEETRKVGVLDFEKIDKEGITKGTVIRMGGDGLTQSGSLMEVDGFSRLSEGDVIIHKKYGAHDVEHQNKEYRLVHLENIIAVIPN